MILGRRLLKRYQTVEGEWCGAYKTSELLRPAAEPWTPRCPVCRAIGWDII
jgi:hypothetical protein